MREQGEAPPGAAHLPPRPGASEDSRSNGGNGAGSSAAAPEAM